MTDLLTKNIMHRRMSLYLKDRGDDVMIKLLANYPALPVINDDREVVGIVSEYEVLDAIMLQSIVRMLPPQPGSKTYKNFQKEAD